MAIHLCIGSVYAWSIYNPALIKAVGAVTSAASDWTLANVTWIFTVAIVFLGLSAAFAGKWLEKVGPRKVGVVAACCWGGGYLVGALGLALHQLWLVYLGYGVIGGCGLGLGYVSPVSTLIRWFPDRRGLATGLAIMGFGGGAILGAPMKDFLIQKFYAPPQYLGTVEQVAPVTENARRFATIKGAKKEVVVVGEKEVSGMIRKGEPGVYVVGTGSVGVQQTFLTLGIGYFVVMLCAAFSYRIPREGWKPEGWTPPDASRSAAKMITQNHVHIDQALKTPQFYQLWIVLRLNVTAGIGVISVAKTMMTDIFGTNLPLIVTSAFAATYVSMISLFNMGGRLFWASLSDYLGRKTTYTFFFVAGILLYLSIPFFAKQVSANPAVLWLVLFYVVTMLIFTMYGGGFATIPAYLADVFGTKYVGGIHGRLLTAWSAAGVLGPMALTSLRERSLNDAIHNLASKIDPSVFAAKFGVGIERLDMLVKSKTVTIPKLMEIVPSGTPDPTSGLYNSTMYLMAGLLGVALISNLFMRPVHPDHHMEPEEGDLHARDVRHAGAVPPEGELEATGR